MRKKNTRRLSQSDNARIKCAKGRFGDPNCSNQATICETVDWNTGNTTGTSFFYFCDNCMKAQMVNTR